MKIARIRVHHISAPLDHPFWMSLEPYIASAELIVEVETSDGVVGFGQIHGRPLSQIAKIVVSAIAPKIIGADPLAHEAIWADVFSLTHTRAVAELNTSGGQPHFGGGASAPFMAALAGVDIALWDLKGKLLGLPVYRLLGGARPTVAVYASGGYYHGGDEVAHLESEAAKYVEMGFRAMKVKIGGLSIDDDVRRIGSVRDAFPDLELMLDANSAYSVPDAITAAGALATFHIRWFEEPTHWYDPVDGLGQVSRSVSMPTASGESAIHRWDCRDLIDRSGIRYMQFDATRAGGVTEWLRVAAYAGHHGIQMAPHHDPQIHAHLVAAVGNGTTVEFFPDHARDPLWDTIYANRPEIAGGRCHLKDDPGFGVAFDWDAVARLRVEPVLQHVS